MKLIFKISMMILYLISYSNVYGLDNEDNKFIKMIIDGNITEVTNLLKAGNDVNTKYNGTPALVFAAIHDRTEIVQLLIDKGAEVNATSPHGSTALMHSATNGCVKIVNILIKSGAYINLKNLDYQDALINAALDGHFEIVKILIINNANINTSNKYGLTPLMAAAINGYEDIVTFLINKGANVNAKDRNNNTILQVIVNDKKNPKHVQNYSIHSKRNNHDKIINILIKANAKLKIN